MLAGDHKDRRQWNSGHQTWFQQRQRALQAGWRCVAHIIKDPHALKTPWKGWLLKSGLPWERGPGKKSSALLWLCRIVTDGEKRDVWRLTVENVSAGMKPEEKEKEENMYRDVSPCPSGDHTERMFFIALFEVSDVASVCSCTLDTRITSAAWSDRTLKW